MPGAGTGTTSPRAVVVAGENASAHNPLEPRIPFVLNSRYAWWPVDYGYGQSYEVFTTSDGGRRWALRGRFLGAEVLGLFFLSPFTGFIETDEGTEADEDPRCRSTPPPTGASTGGRSRPDPG